MKAKVLCDAGEILSGDDVEIVTKVETPQSDEPEYTVRDVKGHEEDVATGDIEIIL
jgi:hypothetical protein